MCHRCDLFVCVSRFLYHSHEVMLIFVNYFADCSFRIKWWAIRIVQARLWTRAARQGWVSWRCVAWWCVKSLYPFTRDGSVSFFFLFFFNYYTYIYRSELDVTVTKCERIYHYDMILWLNHDCVSKLGKVLQSEIREEAGAGVVGPYTPSCRVHVTVVDNHLTTSSSESIDWIWWIIQRTYICRVNKAKNK